MGLRENGAMNIDKFSTMFSYEVNSYLEEKGGELRQDKLSCDNMLRMSHREGKSDKGKKFENCWSNVFECMRGPGVFDRSMGAHLQEEVGGKIDGSTLQYMSKCDTN